MSGKITVQVVSDLNRFSPLKPGPWVREENRDFSNGPGKGGENARKKRQGTHVFNVLLYEERARGKDSTRQGGEDREKHGPGSCPV